LKTDRAGASSFGRRHAHHESPS